MSRKTTAHGRKLARGAGWVSGDALSVAVYRACKLSPKDRDLVVLHTRKSLVALREGRATHDDWTCVAAALRVAQAIEKQGIVKGLHAYFDSAKVALQAIYDRAMMPDGQWVPGALYAAELQAISEMVRLHKFQIDQLGRSELIAALDATKDNL